MSRHSLAGLAAALLLALPWAAARATPAFNMTPVGKAWLVPVLSTADVWVDGRYAYIARRNFGLGVVDLIDPQKPQLVEVFNPGPGDLVANDVKVHRDHVYLSNESYNDIALYILDASDPTQVELVSTLGRPTLNSVHNIWLDGDFLYLAANTHQGWKTHIYDISNPAAPTPVTILPTVAVHDAYVQDDILYESGGWSGLHLWDVSDPRHPVHLAAAEQNQGPRPHYHTHTARATEDGRTIYTSNEVVSELPGEVVAGAMKIYRWLEDDSLVFVGDWQPEVVAGDPLTTIHNIHIVGELAFVSYYQAGVRVLDISVPDDPVEIGWSDTYEPEASELFEGCWGVWADSGERVIATDRLSGVHVIDFNGARRATLIGTVVDADGEPVESALLESIDAGRQVVTDADGTFQLDTGSGSHHIVVEAPGLSTWEGTVALAPNAATTLVVELEVLGDGGVPSPLLAAPRLSAAPNPFHDSVTLTVPFAPGARELRIVDVTGRAVRVIELTSGGGNVAWDGRRGDGSRASTGIYFALTGDERHRLVLIR